MEFNLTKEEYYMQSARIRLVHDMISLQLIHDNTVAADSQLKEDLDIALDALWRAYVRVCEDGSAEYRSSGNARVKLASKATPYRKRPDHGTPKSTTHDPEARQARADRMKQATDDMRGMISVFKKRMQSNDQAK